MARRYGLLALGVLGMIGGAILLAARLRHPFTGYFAVDMPAIYSAVAVFGAGLALVAGWIGFALARRSMSRKMPTP